MFYSQHNQDEYLERNIFKGYKNGVFVDVGAYDGKLINNTLYFEENNNWSGINIEPLKDTFNELVLNRPNCININCAVSNNNGYADFYSNSGFTILTSGLKELYDKRHLDRLNNDTKNYPMWYKTDPIKKDIKTETNIIKVKTMKLEDILDENKVKHINYLSIDVEGAEFDVIKSINFDKVFIDVIGFENNYPDVGKKIQKYLENNGFKLLHNSIDVFMININSKFRI
tara:strand:- start:3327 stop:4010 length:684 start_codon:yes stop_codon:yes gene_type:complete